MTVSDVLTVFHAAKRCLRGSVNLEIKRFDENERFLLLEVDGYQNGYKNVIL